VILVLDTSSGHLAIALASREGVLIREFHADAIEGERGIHDARLAIETANLFHAESISTHDITRIGLIIGPGSFTGLRIGLSFVKGLAFAVNAGIVPITVHEVLQAANRSHHGYIVTPGYRPDLFYVSESDTPCDIRLLTGEELSKLAPRPMLVHDFFIHHPSSFIPYSSLSAALALATAARITWGSSELVAGEALDVLEPLYLTEFNVVNTANRTNF
jgi:tRNA threonylcarbamoyl adenosine modification protein YeaZ